MSYMANSTPPINVSFTPNQLSSPAIEILVGFDVCFFILCIVGNLFVVITAARTKTLHTPSFLFIISVVIGHLLVGFIILPMFIISHYPEKYMTTPICKVIMFLTKIASNASIASLIPLTFDSFRKHSGHRRKHNLTYSNAMIQVAVVWIFAIVYGMFFPLVYEMVEKIHPYPDNILKFWSTNMCDFSPVHIKAHKMFLLVDMVIMYIIPVIVLGGMNMQIFWWQWKGASKKGHEIDEKGRAAVTKAGVIFLTVFLFCNLGIYTIMMYVGWGPGHFWDIQLWQAVALLIAYAQSWLNVLLLLLFNKPFRQAVLHHQVSEKQAVKNDKSEMKELKKGSESQENVSVPDIKIEDTTV